MWAAKRLDNPTQQNQRTGVAINLNEINIPAAEFKELWQNTKIRKGTPKKKGAIPIKLEIYAEGETYNQQKNRTDSWKVGFEFSYQRDSLIYTKLIEGPKNISQMVYNRYKLTTDKIEVIEAKK